ncbi:hypothetical protein ACPCIR_31245 [Mycobacterium sp. NPDC051198]
MRRRQPGGGGYELVLTATDPAGAEVEHLTLGGPYPAGLQVIQPWPSDTDWRLAGRLTLQVNAFPIDAQPVDFRATTTVSDIVDGSPVHPEDTLWFDDVGWLDKAGVAERDGKTFTTACASDPGR